MSNQEQNQGNPQNLPALITSFLGDNRVMLAQYANKSCAMAPFLRSAMLAIINDYKLIAAVKTERGQATLLGALQHAAVRGLSLNPSEGKSCLIVYGSGEDAAIEYQVMKNGLVEEIMKPGKVKYIMGDVIRERDDAKIIKTIKGDIIEHKLQIEERGKIKGFYAAMVLTDGEQHVTYMTMKEMVEFMKTYGKGLSNPQSAWNKSFEGQGIKTVIRRLLTRTAIAEESSVDEMNKFDEMTAEAKPDPSAPSPDISERFTAAADQGASQEADQAQAEKTDLPLAGESSAVEEKEPEQSEEQKPAEGPAQKELPLAEEPVASQEEKDIF